MYVKQCLAIFLVTWLSTSCAFVPEVSKDQAYSKQCEMNTKKLELSVKSLEGRLCRGGSDPVACLMTFGVIVPAGSFVISGGIVLVGNTLHWLEYQGTCEKGFVLDSVNKLQHQFKDTQDTSQIIIHLPQSVMSKEAHRLDWVVPQSNV